MSKHFGEIDLSGAVFRETDLSNARMYGVLLINADIDGAINGLRVNGVEVAPLIAAELDRLHPERTKLRPTTPEGMREALTVVESIWAPTMARAAAMPEEDLHRSINDEWSFTQTLRHLVFVTDAWFGRSVLGLERPFHPLGLPAGFIADAATFGIDEAATPTFAEVTAARADRLDQLRKYFESVTQEDLDRIGEPNHYAGFPPPAPRTAVKCLHVVLNEEWTHHQFAIRDLNLL